jgi:hypothetical protein
MAEVARALNGLLAASSIRNNLVQENIYVAQL